MFSWKGFCLICILTIGLTIERTAGDCQKGWKDYNGHCYFFSPTKKSWRDAKDECEKKKGHLVAITSSKENDFFTQQIKLKGQTHWIGGTDTGVEGHWAWEATGEKLSFTKWSPGQPDNNKKNENCLQIWARDYLWNDGPCEGKLKFICKKSDEKRRKCCSCCCNSYCSD